MNPVLVLAVAAALAASAIARPLDSGGRIGDYIERIVSASGKRHEIRGDCMSACTLWLGHAGVCVAPDAKLWFHAPRDAGSSRFQGSSVRSSKQSGVKTLMAFYPPRVRVVVQPWLLSSEYHTLTGAQLIALGVPAC